MNVTEWAISRNRVVGIFLVVVALMGVAAYRGMPRNDMPPYTIRFASVVTQFAGASPERVESLITDPIEEVIQEVPELKSVTSESRTGLSVVTVELRQDVPEESLQGVWDRLRRKLSTLSRTLPTEASPPNLKDDGLGTVYGVVVGLQNDGFSYSELEHYAEYLRDRILRLETTSEVKIAGLQPETIYVDYDPARLGELGLTATSLQQILATTNIVYPGGSIVLGKERIILEPSGNFSTVEELKTTLVSLPSGGSMSLQDIASVDFKYATPTQSLVRINGKEGASLSVALRENANIIRLGEEVDALMAAEMENIPVGLNVFRVAYQDREVARSVSDFVGNLLQSVAVVLLVMLVMLGLRTGVVVASLIPMTILATLAIMVMMGQGLNQVTLAALIMALGMLVDNAIVMSEAMLVEMEGGAKPVVAAKRASQELMGPLLISSLTTSAAFLAFFLAESLMGDIVGPLFIVISIALLSSWALSLTLIPMLVVLLVRPKKKKEPTPASSSGLMGALERGYLPILRAALRFRWLTVGSVVVLFVIAISSADKLPFIFFPDSDRPLVQVDVNLPSGASIEATNETVADLEAFIASDLTKEVVNVTSFIGEGPVSYSLGYQPGEANSSYAHLLVNTASGDQNQTVIDRIHEFSTSALLHADVRARRLAGGGGGIPIEIRIFGPSPKELYKIGETVKQMLLKIPGSNNVGDSWGPRIKKFVINMRPNDLRLANLSNQDVAIALQTVLTGFSTGEFRKIDKSIPIIMRADDATHFGIEDIRNITITPPGGGQPLPLSQVASIDLAWQYPRIRRRNLVRLFSVTSYLKAGFTASDVMAPLEEFLREEKKNWPRGYRYELGGESEQSNEGMSSVATQLPLSLGIIVLLLVFQFNSVRRSFIVLSTVPLGLIGVIGGLHLFGSFLGFFAFLGIISLAGIVINNAIVLLDRIRIEQDENQRDPSDAIVAACQHRLRPIILTTLTTTLGLVPLYLGGGLMWEPMAVAIMVGLLFGTAVTLIFVPTMYSLLFRLRRNF